MNDNDIAIIMEKIYPRGTELVNFNNFFKIIYRYDEFKRTGRALAKGDQSVMSPRSKKAADPTPFSEFSDQSAQGNDQDSTRVAEPVASPVSPTKPSRAIKLGSGNKSPLKKQQLPKPSPRRWSFVPVMGETSVISHGS